MIVEVDDVEDENIIEWFPRCNAFVKEGLEKEGGGVLVHWYVCFLNLVFFFGWILFLS